MNKYSALVEATAESLNKMTVKDLRILSKGRVKGYSSMKKSEIITALLIEKLELTKATADIDTSNASLKSVGLEVTEKGEFLQRYAIRFRNAVDQHIDLNTGNLKSSIYGELSALATSFVLAVSRRPGKEPGSLIKPEGVMAYKTDFRNLLDSSIGNTINRELLSECATILDKQISKILKDDYQRKNTDYQQSVAVREKDKSEVESKYLLQFAEYHLTNIDTFKNKMWKKVSIAIAIATGRRPSEVHGSNTKFEVKNKGLMFTGQLKTRGDAKAYYEEEPAYFIPCLVAPELVVAAHSWLREKGKLEDTPKAAHNRFSRYLNEEVTVLGECIGTNAEKLTYKSLRAIYSEVAVQRANPPNPNRYKAEILGHSRGDYYQGRSELTDTLTPQSYGADWLVKE